MARRRGWSLVQKKVLATQWVQKKERRWDFQMARSTDSMRVWKSETPTVPLTDSNSDLQKDQVRLWEHPKLQWKVVQRDESSDRMMASKLGLPMAPLTDSNLASTKELESPWEQLREQSRAGPKVPGKA
jgi:hypothetical protein